MKTTINYKTGNKILLSILQEFFDQTMFLIFKALIIVVLLISGNNVMAQFKVSHDIQQIHDNYIKLGDVLVNIEYNMYENDSTNDILESSTAHVYKSENFQLLDFMGYQTWYMKNHTIVVMPTDKKIVLGDPVEQMQSTAFAGISLDTLLQIYKVTQKEIRGQIVYSLAIPEKANTPYKSMDIYAGDNGLYEKIILNCRFPLSYFGVCSECAESFPRLEIMFNYQEKGFVMPDSESLLAAITKEDNSYSLKGKYSNYQLVNVKYKN
jgi:hypothetical protein